MIISPELEATMISKGAKRTYFAAPQVSLEPSKALNVAEESEKSFQARVVAYAKARGWLVYHTFRSDRSEKGFPDLTMIKEKVLIFAELKSEHGKQTREQIIWARSLSAVTNVFLWRPSDWPEITKILS